MKTKNPLLRNLILVQILAIVAGVGILGLTVLVTTRSNYNHELGSLHQKVQDSLGEQQEKWRTWKQLHLEDALKEDLAGATRMFPIKEIDVRKGLELPGSIAEDEVVLPSELQNVRDDKLVLFAKLDTSHIQAAFPYRSSLALLLGSGLLFIIIILASAKYVQGNIHRPISKLNQAFDAFNNGSDFKVAHIAATGEIKHFINSVERMYGQVKEHEEKVAIAKVADQVVHDIRSPLSVLDSSVSILDISDDKRRTMSNAVSKIKGILKNIDSKYRETVKAGVVEIVSPQLLAEQLRLITSAKRVEYQRRLDLEIRDTVQGEHYSLFAKVQPIEFDRVMSNLINNSVEAITGAGKVDVLIEPKKNYIIIKVSDSGRGIAPADLPNLMQQGVTIGKEDGNGLGLYHAKKTVESWGGSLEIESALGIGTSVTMLLPRAPKPIWFSDKLLLPSQSCTVVIFDDDPSIAGIWKMRFQAKGWPIKLVALSNPDELRRWSRDNPDEAKTAFYLNDLEIRNWSENGLDMAEELKTIDRTLLVTSRFEDEAIRARCEHMGITLIPKDFAGFIPILPERPQPAQMNSPEIERGLV